MITVRNWKNFKLTGKGIVYIGRQMRGLDGSPLGNPFKLAKEGDRRLILQQYRVWLDARLAIPDSPQSRELLRLADLAATGDLDLICWCAPKLCHGSVVREKLMGMHS